MIHILVFFVLSLFTVFASWAGKRLPTLQDLHRIQDVSEPAASPNGLFVLYTVNQTNTAKDLTFSNIWQVSYDGKQLKQLTFTHEHNNYSPQWSPDGKWIAFLSDEGKNSKVQVWKIPASGGTPRQLTHFEGDIIEFIWAPNSKAISFIGREKLKTEKTLSPKPLVVDRYLFKNDSQGYVEKEHEHLYLFDFKSKKNHMLTSGSHDESSPSWSPNGEYIAYVTKRGSDPDRHANYDLYMIEPKNGKEQQLTHFLGSDMEPDWESRIEWSPDSSKIVYLRSKADKWNYYAPSQLAILDIKKHTETALMPLDKWFYKPKWSQDGKKIYTLIEENRTTHLSEIDLQTQTLTTLTRGQRYDLDFIVTQKGIVLLSTDDVHPAELYSLGAKLLPLTHHNKDLLNEVSFQAAEDIEFKSNDGTKIDGLLIKPFNYQSGKKYPAFLNLHGGPVSQFGHEFNFEWQLMAAQGYLIIAPNPRGSSGRGFDFAKAIYADWGNVDVKDVLAAVNYVIKLGLADPNRLAVGGWSYGGMLTNYVIASDSRFKAALSGAGVGNILASYGVDQYTLEYELELGKPWENPDLYLKLSYPFLKSNHIKTPTLFMCGLEDFNVPCLGSEQIYQSLKSQNVATQLILYPNSHHDLDTPSYLLDRLQRYINWLDMYLIKAK